MRFRLLLPVGLFALPVAAQTPDTSRRASGAIVSGSVYDSLARTPLAGAVVQVVDAESPSRFGRTVLSDSLGRYTLADVPIGRYRVGFFHPMLDSLGVEPPLREVQVEDQGPVRADLAIPSPGRLRAAICGAQSTSDAGVVFGTIFGARDRAPVPKVSVTGEWLELSFARGAVVHRFPRLVATTGENGWYALCNVPSGGTITLIASRGADSTGQIEVQIPADGLLRRELYLGPTRAVVMGDAMRSGDTLAPPPRRIHLGDGRLSGTVIAAAGGQPMPGAQAGIVNGPRTRANERGEFTLTDVPLGTRMLEARAIGYYPLRRRVDVLAGAPPVNVALSTLKAVLDTVKVTAIRRASRDLSGFQERSRSGMGRFLTAADIRRLQPFSASDIFRSVSGVRMEVDANTGEQRILVRGGIPNWCSPAIFVNGAYLSDNLTAEDIDAWARPDEIVGIEIYTDTGLPPQFQRALGGCSSIVIWTK